jgi:hypothetical protein
MTLDGLFRGIGDVLQATFRILDADMGITAIMNTSLVCLGFIGLFYWLNWQRKFNAQAENNPDQRK